MVLSKTIASCLLISSVLFTAPALALTFKKGQVLGADGEVYDGASPDQRDAIISNSKREGLFGAEGAKAGLAGSNLFRQVVMVVMMAPFRIMRRQIVMR